MILFLIALLIVFVATGGCALVEAALYAVQRPYIRKLAESGNRSGELLTQFKDQMDYPISAILIFDTILGVGGAAIAGSQARLLFGADFVIWFSLGLSAALLIISQITPKIVGVVYCKPVARFSAIPISIAITILYPLVWLIGQFTQHLKPDQPPRRASEEEVKQMAQISAEEGSIIDVEAELIQHSLELNDVLAMQIMTPKSKVVTLPANTTVKEAFKTFRTRSCSQLPIYDPKDETKWVGVVASWDILSAMAQDQFDVPLSDFAKPFSFVKAQTRGHKLLDGFLKQRAGLFGVTDNGNAIGVVSLTDVVEEIIGEDLGKQPGDLNESH